MIIHMPVQPVHKIEISAKTILFTAGLLLILNLVWIMKDLLLSLFIAFIIMSAVKPLVHWLENRRVPRRVATIVLFLLLTCGFVLIFSLILPPLIVETALLIKHLPQMIASLNPSIQNYINISSLTQYAPNITNQAFTFVRSVFSNAMFVTTTIFFSIYFTIEENAIYQLLNRFLTEKQVETVQHAVVAIEKRLGSWLLGELVLMIVVGVMTYIGLALMGVNYALPLALVAGLLEVVPNLGPTLAAAPAFIVAVSQSVFLGVSTIALSFIVQQTENNLIVPYVMKKVVGLNPIITLIAFIMGGQLFGILGVLLAIPFTLFIETIFIEIFKKS
ncbi:hypothetical protein COY90_04645 [Candidatus Roizmanbacteria bacterium CG_4_10_14_0_8_um_filter_39_9]|uniref:AI-2E family transporter n=1 Tax=Candidatus Roizmanbacteria bacterium CG_4_10_14_0_8_um_filter_39_9 TaxID=1974829 RepID=A0A2M7QBR9_9BACT|nr:MAG: hypothetical protein COY90_04645 [Candidatus Roizmanbacteria bacterium CG_4_10_14_0_8_um_filter_39_9]